MYSISAISGYPECQSLLGNEGVSHLATTDLPRHRGEFPPQLLLGYAIAGGLSRPQSAGPAITSLSQCRRHRHPTSQALRRAAFGGRRRRRRSKLRPLTEIWGHGSVLECASGRVVAFSGAKRTIREHSCVAMGGGGRATVAEDMGVGVPETHTSASPSTWRRQEVCQLALGQRFRRAMPNNLRNAGMQDGRLVRLGRRPQEMSPTSGQLPMRRTEPRSGHVSRDLQVS
jgi:hypothetical protein